MANITSSIEQSTTEGMVGLSVLITELEKHVPVFVLILGRVLGMSLQTPFFNSKNIPAQVRATMVVSMSLMYYLVFMPEYKPLPSHYISFAILMGQEIITGAIFGFCASIIVLAIESAGQLMDVQMGLSMVTLFNPATKSQSSAIGRLFSQMELMVLLASGGHLLLFQAFFDSYQLIPIGGFTFSSPLVVNEFLKIVSKIFYIAVQLALPILVTLFIIDFSLGITNKVSPQINVLELNFAMKPTTGMTIILIICSSLVTIMSEYTHKIVLDGVTILKAISKSIELFGG